MQLDPSQYLPKSTRQLLSDYGRFPPPPDSSSIEKTIGYDDVKIVEERVGRGGYAVVHHGRVDGHDVALKQPRIDRRTSDDEFVAEGQFSEGLTDEKSPPFLVDCYAWGTEPQPWICTEYLPRGTLDTYLEQYVERERTLLPIDTALWMALIIACGVEYAHSQGLTHRDLKPENILLKEIEGSKLPYPQIADWGLAIVPALADSEKRMNQEYAAPEQLDDPEAEITEQEHGEGIDIYQLGLITHFLLTGQDPVTSPTNIQLLDNIKRGRFPAPSDQRASVPDGVDKVVMKATSRQREDRYRNAATYREQLKSLFRSCINIDNIRIEGVDYHRSGATATTIGPTRRSEPSTLMRDWQFELPNSPVHAPLVWTNLLCIPGLSQLNLHDITTGENIAKITFPEMTKDESVSGVAFNDGKLYVLTDSGRLLSARGQTEIATVPCGVNGSLTVGLGTNHDFFITNSRDRNVALRVRPDGSIVWESQFTSPSPRQPPVYIPQQNTLLIASRNGLLELDAISGETRQYDNDIIPPTTQLSLYQNYVYYGAKIGKRSCVICTNISTEQREWVAHLSTSRSIRGLAVTHNEVVATTRGDAEQHGRIVCLERTSGNKRWRFTFGNQSVTPPTIDQNHVCVGLSMRPEQASIPEYMHDIYCFDLESGNQAYRARTDSGTPHRVVPRDGLLIAVTSQDTCIGFTSE